MEKIIMNLNLGRKVFIFISASIILIGVEVTTRVNKNLVYRGDNVKLYIEVKDSKNRNIIFPNIYNKYHQILHLEVV
jgi:hypothetical protein